CVPVDHPSARAGAAKSDVFREAAIEEHRVVMPVLWHEANHSWMHEHARRGGEPARERTKQLTLTTALDRGNADDLAGVDLERRITHARAPARAGEREPLSAKHSAERRRRPRIVGEGSRLRAGRLL